MQSAGFAASDLLDASKDWDAMLIAAPPVQPTITSTTTAATAAAIRTAALAGNVSITVTADIAGTVELYGTQDVELVPDQPGRRIGQITFDRFNSSGQPTRRIRIAGFETSSIVNIFGFGTPSDPDVQDITVRGCVFNGQVLNSATSTFNPKNILRWGLVNCVLRGGRTTDPSGACILINDCRDGFVCGCNGMGAPNAVDPGADDWFARLTGTVGGSQRVNYVNNWAKSRYRNTFRVGGGNNGVLYYSIVGDRGTNREQSNINRGTAFGIKDVDMDTLDTQNVYGIGGTGYFDDTLIAGTVFMGPYAGPPRPPWSQEWVLSNYTARGPADVVLATLYSSMEATASLPDAQVYMDPSNAIVQEAASEPAPPTISDERLTELGFVGGQPFAQGPGYTSDPAALADV